MDWTGYPKNLAPADLVGNVADLGHFLGLDPVYSLSLFQLFESGEGQPGVPDQLAYAFPRETIAWRTWTSYGTLPTAAELLDALTVIPDAPDPDAGELLPVAMQRFTAVAMPDTTVSITMSYRTDPGAGWTIRQLRPPTPTVELDPRLIGDTPPAARLLIRLTVQEDQ